MCHEATRRTGCYPLARQVAASLGAADARDQHRSDECFAAEIAPWLHTSRKALWQLGDACSNQGGTYAQLH
jgi:hypothetical protein